MVKVSAECRRLYRSTLDRCIGRPIDRHSADISVDMSTDISRSVYRPSVGRYVDRHIGRVSVDMSTDISVEGFTKYTWSVDFTDDQSTKFLICYIAIFELLRCLISAFIHKQTNSDFKNSGRNRRHNRPVKNFKIALFCFSAQSRSHALKRRCIRK